MDLFGIIIVLFIVGVVPFFPIDGTIENVILCLIVIAVILSFAHGFRFSSGHKYWNW